MSGRATAWSNWLLFGLMLGLFVAELPFARAPAFVLCIYLTMIAVARLGVRATPIVIAFTGAAIVVPVAVGSWHDSLSSAISDFTPIAIPVVAVVTFVVVRSVRGALELAEARAALRTWRRRTSGTGSVATCTTCLDTRSPRSRSRPVLPGV